ncbi:sulfotransferase family protein [Maricaulis sp. CAU 1757]
MSEAATPEDTAPDATGPDETGPARGRNLVFAGGCPRSGLTLLRRLLDAHSRIHCGPDTGLPPAIALQWQHFARGLGDLHARDFGLQAEAVRDTMARLMTDLIAAPLQTRPDHRLVEKTSLNITAFEALARLLPEARFLHVVRDGRDVAHSLLERDWRDAQGRAFAHVCRPDAAFKYWSDLTAIGLRAEQAIGPDRVLRVRFEDLVRRPKASLTEITRFLGLRYEPAQLHFARRPIHLAGLEPDSQPWLDRPLTAKRIGRGSVLPPPPDTARLLAELGYANRAKSPAKV